MFCRKCGTQKEQNKRCKACAKIYHVKYHEKNKEILNERSKVWYEMHKDEVSLEYKNNQTKRSRKRQYNNDYERKRKMIDPVFKLKRNCSRLINRTLAGNKNGQSILKYLSYTIEDLKKHIENQFDEKMSWENYGIYWHIDHIYPQSLLPYTSMKDENFKMCWALENLRPLEAIKNMRKSNKLVGQWVL